MLKIRELRARAGLKQEEVARACGVSQGSVARWEKDDVTPTLNRLYQLAKLFGCSVFELMKEERQR